LHSGSFPGIHLPKWKQDPTLAHKILIVDDEEMIRDLLIDIVDTLDLASDAVSDGELALQALSADQEIGLVILDMNMPVMSGRECYHQLRKTFPVLPVILSSGMDQDETERQFGPDKNLYFIQKPYSLAKISGLIQSILSAE